CFPNLFKTRKEAIVDRHHQSFLRTNYCILYIIVLHQLLSVWSTGVDSFDLIFSLRELKTVGPDVSRITHQRTPASQKHRSVMHWRLDDECAPRGLFFDDLCKAHPGRLQDSILDRPQ